MKTIVILIAILVLFTFLYKCKHRLDGGEYHSITIGNKTYTPSISQLKLTPTLNTFTLAQVPAKSPHSLFTKCANELRKHAKVKFNGQSAFINTMNEAHLISDAHADLLALLLNREPINYAFACCEWHGDEFKPEMNSLLTFYKENSLNIKRGDSFRWLYPPFVNFASYTSIDDSAELEEANKSLTLIANIDSLTVDDIRARLSLIRKSYSSKRLKDVVNATSVSQKQLKQVQLNALNGSVQAIQEFRRTPSQPRVDVYIEYSYRNERAIDLYVKIHKHTLNVLSHILRSENANGDIYCFRFNIDSLDDGYKHSHELTVSGRRIFIYDNCEYSVVEIPKTKTSFAFDEALFINSEGLNYAIQIEHSEDGPSHKSNFVEALARMTEGLNVNDTITVFRATSYLDSDSTTFNYELKSDRINIRESVIYKSFDVRANDLFDLDE